MFNNIKRIVKEIQEQGYFVKKDELAKTRSHLEQSYSWEFLREKILKDKQEENKKNGLNGKKKNENY